MPSYPIRPSLDIRVEKETWVLIFKALLFNAVISLALLGALSVFNKFEGISQFNQGGGVAYFNSFSFKNFWLFFKKNCLEGPFGEEMVWRLPVSLMIFWNCKFTAGDRDLTRYALWFVLIIPTWFWANDHIPLAFPVFVSGLTYGWLIIKTKPLWPWPAVICHSLANLSLYILAKILQILEYAPINVPK